MQSEFERQPFIPPLRLSRVYGELPDLTSWCRSGLPGYICSAFGSKFVAKTVFRTAAILNSGNLGGPDIPNHKCKYSYGFPMVKEGKIEINFLFIFVTHLAQKL